MGARCANGHLVGPDGNCGACAYQRENGSTRPTVAVADALPSTELRFPRTDAGNAELFCHLLGDQLRFDHRRKRWLRWASHWWIADSDSQVVRLAKDTVRRRYRDAAAIDDLREREAEARWAIQSESKVRLDAMLALARAEKPIADSGEAWDVDPWLLGVGNGVVDLRTGVLRAGDQKDRLTMRTPVEYDRNAECPRWEEFVREVFAGDEEMIDYIRRAVGYSLTGETSEQCHFMCWGGGWNGKTTFQRVQREVMGDYGANTPFSTLEMSARSQISNDLAALNGRRLVIASELNEAVRLTEARLKMLAGEDPVTARFLYGELFTFIPVAKFWLSVNHKPIVNDDSTGFWRKVHLIPFTQSFEGRADKNLKDALRAEYAGILAWMVRGCLAWRAEGLPRPTAVTAATAAYRAESDPTATFLRERCVVNVACRVKASEFYRAYQDWADDAGLKERERLSSTKFGRLMTARFEKKEESGGNVYIGVGLGVRGMEGFVSDDPPVPVSSLEESSSREDWENDPQPSTRQTALSENPPENLPLDNGNPPRCIGCGVAMSRTRVREKCGRCQR